MRLARIVPATLVIALAVACVAPNLPAAAAPAAGIAPRFEPDDKEKLARLTKEMAKLRADLKKLAARVEAARKHEHPEAARAAARRLEYGKRRYARLAKAARGLKAKLRGQRAPTVRKPIRARTVKREVARRSGRRKVAQSRSALAHRVMAARAHAARAIAARRAAGSPPADRLAQVEKSYRLKLHALLKEKGALEKKLKATHDGIAKLKKGYAAIQRAKAARARAAARRKTGGTHRPAQARPSGDAVLHELKALRREMQQLNRTMQAFLGIARKAHGVAPQRAHKLKARKAAPKADKKRRSLKGRRKIPKRKVALDDRFSL